MSFTDTLRITKPRLWSPQDPNLYDVSFTVREGDRKVAGYTLHSGIRSIKVSRGGLVLNGQFLNLRGVGLHEESKAAGLRDRQRRAAISSSTRPRRSARPCCARTTRCIPYTHELADRLGLLIWSEIPVYSVSTEVLKEPSVRRARRQGTESQHPRQREPPVGDGVVDRQRAVLAARPGADAYINAAAEVRQGDRPDAAGRLRRRRLPELALPGRAEYKSIDVLGLNDYFGWYPGPSGQIFDRTKLSGYLDAARACYPEKALMVTEFGAEANRDGPIEEKGTWGFQQEWVNYHLGVFATKPWLSGAIYWTLNEFWVRPEWEGGNPRPQSPIHQKGLITYDGVRKPAWTDVQRSFTQTQQIAPAARR